MNATILTSDNFEREVLNSDKPVLIDFWATWCAPCKMIAPTIEELASEVTTAKICKVNVDDEAELAQQFGIMSIPTIVVLNGGKMVSKSVGAVPKAQLIKMLQV